MNQSITIRDVARKSGFSVSTVSHVINGTRHVEEQTRARVQEAITALDYRPNVFARSLKGMATKTLGIIISDIRDEYFSELTKAIESRANERGYALFLCDSEEDPQKESFYYDMLLRKGVDGIILAPVDAAVPPRRTSHRAVPVVQVDRQCAPLGADFFGIDNEQAAAAAVDHLFADGRRRIGFIGYELSLYTMEKRVLGYRRALAARGLGGNAGLLIVESHRPATAEPIREWLAANRGMEAVICGNANICCATLQALHELAVAVPAGMALVSFDDTRWMPFLCPPVTAIRQPTDRLGTLALDLLPRADRDQGAGARAQHPAARATDRAAILRPAPRLSPFFP